MWYRDHDLYKLELLLQFLVATSIIHVCHSWHLLLTDKSVQQHGCKHRLVQGVQFLKRVKVHIVCQSRWHDALNHFASQQLVPMVLDLLQLSINLSLVLVLQLFDHLVLLLNEACDLIFFVTVGAIHLQLLWELLDLFILRLHLLSVLVDIFLQVQQKLLVLDLLLLKLTKFSLFVCKFFVQLLVVSFQVLWISFLNSKHFL